MPDKFDKATRSRIMASIKSCNTGIERQVFRELRRRKIYFQKHYAKAFGKPDVCVPSRKLAVFIDGDFWHGFRYDQWKHKLPSAFWREKIEKNRARDKRNFGKLRRRGWRVLRVWEHQLCRDSDRAIAKIVTFLKK